MLDITDIGKECHSGCTIYQEIGKCVMPKERIFPSVIHGGCVRLRPDKDENG